MDRIRCFETCQPVSFSIICIVLYHSRTLTLCAGLLAIAVAILGVTCYRLKMETEREKLDSTGNKYETFVSEGNRFITSGQL